MFMDADQRPIIKGSLLQPSSVGSMSSLVWGDGGARYAADEGRVGGLPLCATAALCIVAIPIKRSSSIDTN